MEESTIDRLILVIEDDIHHVQLIKAVLEANPAHYQIMNVRDGVQALNFLHQRGEYANTLRPHLILLNLNLPEKDGREVLAEIKADVRLKRIPIIVLTASTAEEDILKSYALQGNSYVIKANNLEELTEIIKRIEEFWLEIVTLPGE